MLDQQEIERRRTERREVDAQGTLGSDGMLRVVNVSQRGLETESAQRLLVGNHCDVLVHWRGEDLPVCGTVVWSKLDRTVLSRAGEIKPVYRSGIEGDSACIPLLERLATRSPGELA
jgi:hypothetical protein